MWLNKLGNKTKSILLGLGGLFTKKERISEHELFLNFMRKKKEVMNEEFEKAMFRYLEEIYKKAISLEKKEIKKTNKISSWVSRDLEIDKERRRKEEKEELCPN